MSVNEENLALWLEALRSGKYEQTDSRLAVKYPDGPIRYCCLGVGCEVAGVERIDVTDDEGKPTGEYAFGKVQATDLAPLDFIEWLGLSPDATTGDVFIDWPDEYALLSRQEQDSILLTRDSMSCANMNDSFDMSFEQIADMLAYFGVRSSPRRP